MGPGVATPLVYWSVAPTINSAFLFKAQPSIRSTGPIYFGGGGGGGHFQLTFSKARVVRSALRGNKLDVLTSKVTTPQDAHRRLVLQVYLGSNTLELSAIHR